MDRWTDHAVHYKSSKTEPQVFWNPKKVTENN